MDLNDANDKDRAQGDGGAINSDLIRGHINTIILRTLYDGDKYGYEIISEIEEQSKNQYVLKQPTLYSAGSIFFLLVAVSSISIKYFAED